MRSTLSEREISEADKRKASSQRESDALVQSAVAATSKRSSMTEPKQSANCTKP